MSFVTLKPSLRSGEVGVVIVARVPIAVVREALEITTCPEMKYIEVTEITVNPIWEGYPEIFAPVISMMSPEFGAFLFSLVYE
jgi:hypothetical protein